jgi:hypothetical protein
MKELFDLAQLMLPDEQAIELPDEESNPWEWTEEHLDALIAHRNKWFR